VAETAAFPDTSSLAKAELQLKQFADSIAKGSNDKVREAAAAAFNPIFFDLLMNNPATFSYPFDSLPTVSKIKSHDGNLRIYTWLMNSWLEGTYRYYGIVQRYNPSTKQLKTIGLLETDTLDEAATFADLKTDSWYGAIYYEIIEKKINKKTSYFLLGWKGRDRLSTRKVIDAISFDAWDNISFGMPVFLHEKKNKYRVIFEFNAQAVMSLKYDKKKKMILFDHLSPSSPSLKGQYRYYGPDFTYDGFQFKKGIWNYKSNLELRNPGEKK